MSGYVQKKQTTRNALITTTKTLTSACKLEDDGWKIEAEAAGTVAEEVKMEPPELVEVPTVVPVRELLVLDVMFPLAVKVPLEENNDDERGSVGVG
jgi:hypothetical protein